MNPATARLIRRMKAGMTPEPRGARYHSLKTSTKM